MVRKIAEIPKPCTHLEHNPPTHIYLEPGVYEHTCPGCGRTSIFTVPRIAWAGGFEVVVKGPQPEAHKDIYDYRDQLAAKRKRKRRELWK